MHIHFNTLELSLKKNFIFCNDMKIVSSFVVNKILTFTNPKLIKRHFQLFPDLSYILI